jgi:hypothetical protein
MALDDPSTSRDFDAVADLQAEPGEADETSY